MDGFGGGHAANNTTTPTRRAMLGFLAGPTGAPWRGVGCCGGQRCRATAPVDRTVMEPQTRTDLGTTTGTQHTRCTSSCLSQEMIEFWLELRGAGRHGGPKHRRCPHLGVATPSSADKGWPRVVLVRLHPLGCNTSTVHALCRLYSKLLSL